jgi:hypothetical protein
MTASIPPWAAETAHLERIRRAEAQSWLRARLRWEHRLAELEQRTVECEAEAPARADTTGAA